MEAIQNAKLNALRRARPIEHCFSSGKSTFSIRDPDGDWYRTIDGRRRTWSYINSAYKAREEIILELLDE